MIKIIIMIMIVITITIIILIMEFAVAFPQSGSSSTFSRSNQNLEVLIFVEGEKPENPEKNPRSKDENKLQTQPTCDAGSGTRTRATVVGGEYSHHCVIPAALAQQFKTKVILWLVTKDTHNPVNQSKLEPKTCWRHKAPGKSA